MKIPGFNVKIKHIEKELGMPTQIGILVKDAKSTANLLSQIIGMGPWSFEDWPPPNRSDFESFYKGKPTVWRAILAFAYYDNIEIELIETYEGSCGYTDYIKTHGEGIHHIQFRVYDVDQTAERFTNQGIDIKMGATGRRPGTKWVLLDTLEMFGFDVELTSK